MPQQAAWVRPFDRIDLVGAAVTGVWFGNQGRRQAVLEGRKRGISERHIIRADCRLGYVYVMVLGRGSVPNSAVLAGQEPGTTVEVLLDGGSANYRPQTPFKKLSELLDSVAADYASSTLPGAMCAAVTSAVLAWTDGTALARQSSYQALCPRQLQRAALVPLKPWLSAHPEGSNAELQEAASLVCERVQSGPGDVRWTAQILTGIICQISDALSDGRTAIASRDFDVSLAEDCRAMQLFGDGARA